MTKTIKVILIVTSFFLLSGLLMALTYNINSDADSLACKTDIGLAKSGKPSAFSSCHNYKIIFEKNSAVKYDMTTGNKEIDKYSYSTVLLLVKNLRPDLKEIKVRDKDDIVSKEIIYYIIAEEMRKCNEVYFAPYFRSMTDFYNCQYSFVCQSCSLFMFDESFYLKTKTNVLYEDFNDFFVNTPYIKKADLTYSDYFGESFSQIDNSDFYANDKVKSIINKTNGGVSFGVIDTSKIYNIMYFFRPVPAAKLKEKLNVKDSKVHQIQYGVTGKYNYIQPLMIQIVDQDSSFKVCDMYLNLAPNDCPALTMERFTSEAISILKWGAYGGFAGAYVRTNMAVHETAYRAIFH